MPAKTAATTQAKPRQPFKALETITPCLWFDGQAEQAARFYVSIFPDSSLDSVVPSPTDYPAGKKGDTVVVEFTLMGRKFTALNGGPFFHLSEAVSFIVPCKDQAQVDRYWKALSAVPQAEQCGWLKDKFGASWQIVPTRMFELLADPDPKRAARAYEAMMGMKKLDIAALERAARGR
jgi:predicted 3-demethylubiquinone-9 3-methyltransferase (glyoxalase superfamily)